MRVVLVEPEIHWNAGNVGRTCVATGTSLHLVCPLGFSLDAAAIRRSGLDYWERLDLKVHDSLDAFLGGLSADASLLLFTADAPRTLWEAPFTPESWLLFGRESVGLPDSLLRRFAERTYRIPQTDKVRSLNVSTAAGVAVYEGLRRTGGLPAQRMPGASPGARHAGSRAARE